MSIYRLEAGTAQHVGNRPRQHDRAALFTATQAPGYVLAVVGDGGATNAIGAEQLLHTSKQLLDEFRPGDAPSVERVGRLLRAIAQETHDVLLMNPLPDAAGALSTMALLVLTPDRQAIWATVGDTRLYRFANGAPAGKTDDADYIDHLVTADKLPLEAARRHRASRLLNNALGNRLKAPFVSVGCHEDLQPGDGFLLCTDGLWSWFADGELAAAVSRRTPRQAAELLIDKARERAQGNGDNCTMAILRLVSPVEGPSA
ncbi:PP2C family protein-serine/threonine phosphatase [Pseudoduganella umbonata]|uniref:Serine/threonine protein phosphatase PrpC n=1 Tax=Pseudoduganella umbonata TaxID=864828 RepID=A0A4P8HS08_9BURK|nr:serine/threonine-protein phosphatase [Pseudoduganella umbonata]MBB3224862.1 serine/threonine protein phosphatase PrpC [Pseudoduganella umbonata]QCP11165.1 serine/threonine-protein phosphatase [Pseudoduganella umbonata]